MRVGIIAGELSGDYLAAGLMRELRLLHPDVEFVGIGGERMADQGMQSYYPLESLSVMGLMEVLRHLPSLLRIRRDVVRRLLEEPPDLFIGVDAPDFNLGVERRLKQAGIPTVHYVSPTVWAWRQGRVKTIRRSVDLMLSIFPFEAEFFRKHDVPVTFVGHPLADEVSMEPDRAGARQALGLEVAADGLVVALLPGSRMSEVQALGSEFLATAAWLAGERSGLRFVIPCATGRIRAWLEPLVAARAPGLDVTLVDGRSRDCMAAADAVLLASGTATLEAMLHKRPMVVAYKVSATTAWLARKLVKVPHFAMPNLIGGRQLVQEFAQEDAVPRCLGPAMLELLNAPEQRKELMDEFARLHAELRRNASHEAALAVDRLYRETRA
ncbi:MAG: lipid-A-disaccharide synthase [Ectothiorhodospiraceae bacterium]|nr:lipid-A-disaccharide synthase [Ectothiorhodospiraceae bacterium]MCH8504393.1 lipid-A-disaccharide synthase [Ectothiorhodospiraceae bacterium]